MEEKILVTVVVPIYNVEQYLSRCIDSLLNQSYKNLEILLINDGSKDNSISICNEKAKQDNRIRIITQENQGLSAARNTGINNATGEYICFVDSDDFVHENYVKLLLENLIDNQSDISVCDFSYINEKEEIWNRIEKKSKIFTNMEGIKDILVGIQETEVMSWNKLYKLSLFKDYNIYFPKGKLHEDNFTTYKLYYYSKKISLIPDKLYFYLQRSNSIMGKKFNIKRLDIIDAVEETKEFFNEKKIDMSKEIEAYDAIIKITILNTMIRDEFYGEERLKLIEEIKKDRKKYLKNQYINKKEKLGIFILFGKGKIYKTLLLIFDKIKQDKRKYRN